MKKLIYSAVVQKRTATLMAVSVAAFSLAISSVSARAAVVLIDLNNNAASPLPAGSVWNTYAATADINGGFVADSTGILTPLTFSSAGTITANTANFGVAVFDPNQAGTTVPSWVGTTTENGAAGDNFFTSNTGAVVHSFTLTFAGLTPGNVLSLDLLASRNSGSALGYFEYSLDAGATWLGFNVLNADGSKAATNGWDTLTTAQGASGQVYSLQSQGFLLHRYLNVSGVTLTGSTFAVRTTDANATATTFSAVNAMRLSVVPEPATASALLLGTVGLSGFLRRRRS